MKLFNNIMAIAFVAMLFFTGGYLSKDYIDEFYSRDMKVGECYHNGYQSVRVTAVGEYSIIFYIVKERVYQVIPKSRVSSDLELHRIDCEFIKEQQ